MRNLIKAWNDIKGLKIKIFTTLDKFKSKKRALKKNAYKAITANQFKNIEYKLVSAKIVGKKDYAYNSAIFENLTIA